MAKAVGIGFDREHFNRIEAYVRKMQQLYFAAAREAANISSDVKFDDSKPFSFDDYPKTKQKIDAMIEGMTSQMKLNVDKMTRKEWIEACYKNDVLIDAFASKVKIPTSTLQKYKSRNLEALKAFQERKTNGLNLSDRVWNYTNQFKGELELALDIGLGEGKSAAQLSRDIRSYLQEPEKLFRRVRDKHGNLQLSKYAKKYQPGPGVYRSSYKNAMRLTRTEVNMAYRRSDYEKNQQLDFVVGFEVRRSNHVFACSVCESLTGKYPKTFLFVGWHPHCRCHCITITATQEEFIEHEKKLLAGEESTLKSKNEVRDIPDNFKQWVKDNQERIDNAKSKPYFIGDNAKLIKETSATKVLKYNSSFDLSKLYSLHSSEIIDAFEANYKQMIEMVDEGDMESWLLLQRDTAEYTKNSAAFDYWSLRYKIHKSDALYLKLEKFGFVGNSDANNAISMLNNADVIGAEKEINQLFSGKITLERSTVRKSTIDSIKTGPYTESEKIKLLELYTKFEDKVVSAGSEHEGVYGYYNDYVEARKQLDLQYFENKYALTKSEMDALNRYLSAKPVKRIQDSDLGDYVGGRFTNIESDNLQRLKAFSKNHNIPVEELELVSRYTYGSGFVSRYIYGNVSEPIELIDDYIEATKGVVKKLPKYEGRSYAGLSFGKNSSISANDFISQMKELEVTNGVYELKTFQSTTTSINVTSQFLGGDKYVMLVIDGKSGVNIKPLSKKAFMNEEEILMNIGTKFKVRRVYNQADDLVMKFRTTTYKEQWVIELYEI